MTIPIPLDAAPPALTPSPQRWPLLRLDFRPFHLGAAIDAMLAVRLRIAMLLGQQHFTALNAALARHWKPITRTKLALPDAEASSRIESTL